MSDDRRERPDDRRLLPRGGGRRAADPPAEWVSITVYAKKHGVSRVTVYKWLSLKLLDTYQAGRVVRIFNKPPRNISGECSGV